MTRLKNTRIPNTPCPSLRAGDVRYSGFNMGAGESAVFEILMALFEAGRGSLLIIDELELGLHEQAQIKFVQELKQLCNELHCQVICSTHSHVVLQALPPEGRFFLETTDNRTLVTNPVSPDYACGKLRGANVGELDVFVEDELAASILRLGIPHHLRQRVNIVPIGSSSAVIRMMASRYLEGKDNCLDVLDGDKRSAHAKNISLFGNYAENRFRESKEEMESWAKKRLTYLPSENTPERWLGPVDIHRNDHGRMSRQLGTEVNRDARYQCHAGLGVGLLFEGRAASRH